MLNHRKVNEFSEKIVTFGQIIRREDKIEVSWQNESNIR